MNEVFLKPYNFQTTEDYIYDAWEKSGFFNPDVCVARGVTREDAPHFSIVLPPPNVTGVLHIGHAYEDSLQDSVVRFQRMRGKQTVWIPGTDSAAIATQARVEKNIQKEEGKSRHDLGREELVRRVSEFAKNSEQTILSQVRKVGASLDWSRYAYTMDEKRNRAVAAAFKRMYDAGLVYRGNRIVNWDPKGQTTISDDEIKYEERPATLYTFRYTSDFPIPVATTRLETKVGDVAVAVNPDDARYAQYIGCEYDVTFVDTPLHIKIVADKDIDPTFGTGAVGVTPTHSMIDWQIAERHNLPRDRVVINELAKMTVEGRLAGLKTLEAREKIAEWLREHNLLEKEEDIVQNISTSERTGGIIEPLPKVQWFVSVNTPFTLAHSDIPGIASGQTVTLKELMHIAVEKGGVDMPQEGFRNSYFHWIDNLRDWCISRQIWFGHRIPVWYRGNEIRCDIEQPQGDGWAQDPDVFDTWFSSELWTFSTLGWPEQTKDLERFHPTSFMSPAYEILFLWVSRMILASGFLLGQVPFRTVLIHGLVRDKQGRKFSKSLNNGINPLDMIETYGADALRMGLLAGTPIGSDVSFDESKVKGYKNFANKIWNITRFILENSSDLMWNEDTRPKESEHLQTFNAVAATVTDHMENYRIHLAIEEIYHYIWHQFADIIIEESKPILKGEPGQERADRQILLYFILLNSLKLLHPFMPFVTEEIWSHLPFRPNGQDMLMVSPWPVI